MNLDRDLRDALAPLAGDPTADAARVLQALPPPGLPPIGWWLGGSGLVLGLLLGIAVGRSTADAPPQPAPQPTTPVQAPDAPQPHDPKPPQPWPMPRDDAFYLMAFGELAVEEPGRGPGDLKPGAYDLPMGTLVRTTDLSRAGVYTAVNDSRMRLDCSTTARITAVEVTLEKGRLWLHASPRHPGDLRIASSLATAMVTAGRAIADHRTDGLQVLSIDGTVVVRTAAGQTAQLQPGQLVWVDPDQGLSSVEKVPFLGSATSWMTDMVLMEQDQTELHERVREMVAAYEEGTHRAAAALEIRKLGTTTLGLLVDIVQRSTTADPDFARATAALAADVVEYRTVDWMFPLLESDDIDVRLIAFRGLRRATGTDGGTDEEFWRDASTVRRRDAIQNWKKRPR